MRLLVSAINERAGKTSFVVALSKLRRFRYEKLDEKRGAEKLLPEDGDFVVVEGRSTYKTGLSKGRSDLDEKADHVILIARWEEGVLDEIEVAKRLFGNVIGVVLNSVTNFRDLPSDLLGAVPFKRELCCTAREVAECMGAEVLAGGDAIVTDFLIGAMSPPCAREWMIRKKDSALVTGGDRVDLIKMAVDVGVSCLILSGGFEPPRILLKEAEAKGISVVLSSYDTFTTLEIAKRCSIRPLSEEKAEMAAEHFLGYIDFDRILRRLSQ